MNLNLTNKKIEKKRFILSSFLTPGRFLLSCCCICLYNHYYTCIKVRSAKAISTITWFTINHSLAELTLDALMFGSSHFKRGLWASRLMPYQIKGEVVKINAVQRQLCFPLECSEWQSFYVGEKTFPHVFKYDENAPGTVCHGSLLYGFKIPLC